MAVFDLDGITVVLVAVGIVLLSVGSVLAGFSNDENIFMVGSAFAAIGVAFLSMILMPYVKDHIAKIGRMGCAAIGIVLFTPGLFMMFGYTVNRYYPLAGAVLLIFGIEILIIGLKAKTYDYYQ
jgi:MFS family permease